MDRRTSLVKAVRDSLAVLRLGPQDEAAARLALEYASTLDGSVCPECSRPDVARVGPALLAVLESLGATPRARSAVKGATGEQPGRSQLDAARERRSRQRGAASVDPASS